MFEDNELSMEDFGNDFEFNFEDFQDFSEEQGDGAGDNPTDTTPPEQENVTEGANSEEVGNEGQEEGSDASEDEGNSSSNFFSTLTGFIHDKGLLPSLDLDSAKIETEEDFVSALKQEVELQARQQAENYLRNLNLEAIARSNNEVLKLDQLDEDALRGNIEQAKSIIYNDYINQGLNEARATRLLEKLVDLGEDAIIEEALTSKESLKEFESARIEQEKQAYEQARIQEEKEYNERQELIKKTVFEKKDLFKNYNLPQALRKEVYETMNAVVSKNPETGELENKFMKDRRENPVEFDTRMYYVYTMTKGFTDFSNIVQKGKSSAVKELEETFKNIESINNNRPS